MAATAEATLIALAGGPNTGKTALFNAITGHRQKVANYPGVTVEKKLGRTLTPAGRTLEILDLPGTYSLKPHSPDEQIALDVLLNRYADGTAPQALVMVADATNLERNLNLVLELTELDKPVVLALNMMDLAKKRGLVLDLDILSQKLGIPVVPTVAIKKRGIQELLTKVDELLNTYPKVSKPLNWHPPSLDQTKKRHQRAEEIIRLATKQISRPDVWTERIDKVVLHPIVGPIVLVTILASVFQAVFTWAEPFMGGIEGAIEMLGAAVASIVPEGAVQSLLVDGIIAGVGAVLVFLPQIIFLFFFILILEDSGYMGRAAFLMDRLMGRVGLHGRAFIPLLSSFACAIPGIMAARTVNDKKSRLTTILIAPLMTCSARLPVYSLLIAAFIPNLLIWGPFRLQGLVMFGLYVGAVLFGILVAFLLRNSSLKGPKPSLLLELPSYRIPSARNITFGLLERTKIFLRRAGKLILFVAMALWFLASYPKPPENATRPDIHYSFAGRIGHAIEPLIEPLGFDWRIGTGLIPGFAAREVMVGALGTVFAVEAASEEETEVILADKIKSTWALPTALALLVWYIFSPQCLATFAVMRRETNSWKWTAFGFTYMLALAYIGALVTYQITRLFL